MAFKDFCVVRKSYFFVLFYIGVLLALKKCVSDAKSAVEKGGFCQCFTNFFVVFNKKGECKM